MTQDTKGLGIIKAVRKGENFPEKIHAHSAVVRFPSGVESGNWQSQPNVETKEYARLDLLTAAEARAEAAEAERDALAEEIERLRKALDDAINEAMGVVPESASAFYDYRAGRVRTRGTDR